MNIGRNTLYFRQQQGLTQQQLADALGINKISLIMRKASDNRALKL